MTQQQTEGRGMDGPNMYEYQPADEQGNDGRILRGGKTIAFVPPSCDADGTFLVMRANAAASRPAEPRGVWLACPQCRFEWLLPTGAAVEVDKPSVRQSTARHGGRC